MRIDCRSAVIAIVAAIAAVADAMVDETVAIGVAIAFAQRRVIAIVVVTGGIRSFFIAGIAGRIIVITVTVCQRNTIAIAVPGRRAAFGCSRGWRFGREFRRRNSLLWDAVRARIQRTWIDGGNRRRGALVNRRTPSIALIDLVFKAEDARLCIVGAGAESQRIRWIPLRAATEVDRAAHHLDETFAGCGRVWCAST